MLSGQGLCSPRFAGAVSGAVLLLDRYEQGNRPWEASNADSSSQICGAPQLPQLYSASKILQEINDRAFPQILPEDKSLSFRLTVNLTGCLKGQSSFFHAVCKGEMTKQVANMGTGGD